MASNACELLCLLLLLAFVTQGFGECGLSYLAVRQSKTGRLVQNKPEWKVRVTNPCRCNFQYTYLTCAGFQSVTPVPTSVLSKTGDQCLLNAGKLIYPLVDIVFTYVWDTSYDFKVIDGVIVCP